MSASPLELPDGFYTVPDPDDPEVIRTCRRNRNGKRQFTVSGGWMRNTVPSGTWTREDDVAERQAWFARVVAAVMADPEAARKEFQDSTGRCGWCGLQFVYPEWECRECPMGAEQ